MSKLSRFIYNVAALTVTSLILRSVSLSFSVFLKGKLGADGIGLFTLITSVYGFALTFATGGINLSATRLCSEALEGGKPGEVKGAMKKCIAYSLFFGISALLLLFTLAPIIGKYLLDDTRVVPSLRIFALSLPAIALSSAFSGYFTAMRRASKSALSQLAEQFSRIAFTVLLLSFSPPGLEYMCMFVVLGSVCSDIISFLFSFTLYIYDMHKHHKSTDSSCTSSNQRLLSIALPVAVSAYFRSGLVTVEHLLIPWGLKKRGESAASALASYGTIQAMALPIVLYPYAFLTPFCTMLVPEIAGKYASGDEKSIKSICERAMKTVLILGIGTAGVMLFSSELIGGALYSSPEAASYIKMLAPLIPIMYIDTCIDSVLKGADEQMYTMKINIVDASLSVLFVFLFVPRFGARGYILSLFSCEIINMSLSYLRLSSKIKPRINIFTSIFMPILCASASGLACFAVMSFISPNINKMSMFFAIALFTLFYFVLLWLFGIVKIKDALPILDTKKAHSVKTK